MPARTPPQVGVIGSLCSSDLVLANAFRAAGLPATVLRPTVEDDVGDRSPELFPHLRDEDVVFFDSPRALLRRLRRFDVVFSFTAALGLGLDRVTYAYPVLRRLGWPPYVNVSTGADITERALAPTRAGLLERFTMRHAFAQGVPPYPDAVHTAAAMRLHNACVLPPVQLTLPELDAPRPPRQAWRFRRSEEELLLLHPSHLDWGQADAGPRASTKGNDRFLRALALLVAEIDRPVRAVVLERGSDRENAKTLVRELGLDDHVSWHQDLPRSEFFRALKESDVVVDQFDIGALGMIAWEAFNLGRPVLTYVHETCERLAYDENSAVLNAHSVDEILDRLREAADPTRLRERTEAARRWAAARTMEALLPRYLFYATLASGKPAADFGWDRPYGHPRSAVGG